MGAITCVPREVVPPVNHSPGFAVLRGSGVLSQVDIPSSWGLPGLTAAGERKRTVLIPPTSLLGSLPPSFGEQEGWGCVKPVCCMNWCGPLLLGMARERQGLQSFTQDFGLVPHSPWVIPWRTKPAAVWDSPGCQVLPSPRHESPGSGRVWSWSRAPSATGTSCPGSQCSLSWRKPSVGSCARSACAKGLPHPGSWGLLTHNGDRH